MPWAWWQHTYVRPLAPGSSHSITVRAWDQTANNAITIRVKDRIWLLRLDKGLKLTRSLRFVSLHFCPGLIAYNDYNTNKDGKASPGAHGVYLTNGGFWKSAFQLAEIAKTVDFVEKSGKNPFFAIPVSPKGSVQGSPKRPFLPLFDPPRTPEDPWGTPGNRGAPIDH